MKKLILIAFIPVLFSFSKNEIQKEYKFVWLKKNDWKELEKISYVGKNQVTVVHRRTRLAIMNDTQYKSKTEPFTKKQRSKLELILKKYE